MKRYDVQALRAEQGVLNGNQWNCLEMVASVVGPGRHNMPGAKVATCGETGVDITNIHTNYLNTYDFDGLTTLVVKAHQRAIRVEVLPHTFRTLRIRAFQRKPWDEELSQFDRHPGIPELIERLGRLAHPSNGGETA